MTNGNQKTFLVQMTTEILLFIMQHLQDLNQGKDRENECQIISHITCCSLGSDSEDV